MIYIVLEMKKAKNIVALSGVLVAAKDCPEAEEKWRKWAKGRFDYSEINSVYLSSEPTSDIIPCSSRTFSEVMSLEKFEAWEKVMTVPQMEDGKRYGPVWRIIQ